MILPTIRASFGRRDAQHLVELLGRDDPELRADARRRLDEDGVDALLDDPRLLNALLAETDVRAPTHVIFYVLVRQALLEGGLGDRSTADFVASVLLAFLREGRAYRISDEDDEEFHYLVDLVTRLGSVRARRAFLLRTHLGNYALWLAGLFPDFLETRTRRRGAPGIDYYESLGRSGYRMASESPEAESLGVADLFRRVSEDFPGVRVALNRVSDRYLWRSGADPVGRLIREVSGRAPRPGAA